ncbi:MAG: NAD-dependent epimerase/dehydratase family protein [Deferribacteraceae bacterium]|jgi:nucleoside-diphosphate-sugar epimerase|nr:NAD-dependent epimerase/dehydratase family protein [Deferribacteraceae bacterium]
MLALITGGSGYFGSVLVKKLLERGYVCRIFDLNDADDRPKDAEFIKGDIRDYEAVLQACRGADVVHHNVAQVPLAKDHHLFQSVNIGGTENLLRACGHNGVGKVVHTSSSAVFGVPSVLPVTENTFPAPAEAYGRAKFQAEEICGEYIKKGLDVSIVRPRTILGHGRLGIFQILFEWVSEGAKIPVLGKGDNIYQFVHSDDLAEVCIRAGERAGASFYNSGAVEYGTMRELLQGLCDYAATGAKVRSVPMGLAVFAMKITGKLRLSPLSDYHWLMYGRSMYFDNSKIKTELDFTPRYSNNQMICESYDWYLKNKESLTYAGQGASAHRSALKQGILKLIKLLP